MAKGPDALFVGTPVDVVARYFLRHSPVQFTSDPSETDFQKEEWRVWYAPSREDAFLSDLHAVHAHSAYLVHSSHSFRWSVTGEVKFKRARWQVDSLNFKGFSVDSEEPPTFQEYFQGAEGKIGERIYRLEEGQWKKIDPRIETMRSGEAYWVSCEGKTDYQGVVHIGVDGVDSLHFGAEGGDRSLTLRNCASEALPLKVESLPSEGVAEELPLVEVRRATATLEYERQSLSGARYFGLNGRSRSRLKLAVDPESQPRVGAASLLKLTDSLGSVYWIPARYSSQVSTAAN